jgi:hypothetical protein
MEKTIWVLGSEHSNAHKSISWLSPFPNFSNCDILIVNLQSLGAEQIGKRSSELFNEARKYIFDMLMTGEKETIIVLSSEQLHVRWLPLFPIVKEIAHAEVGEYSAESPVDEYIKTVESCPFYIHEFEANYFIEKTDPTSAEHENYSFTAEVMRYDDPLQRAYEGGICIDSEIFNKAKQKIGCRVSFFIDYGYERKKRFRTGNLYFLPPPTKCTAEQAIDMMVNILTGAELLESPPAWENKIDMPKLRDIEREIMQEEEQKDKLIKEIDELKVKKVELIKFRRLLWTKGTPLENVVREAFAFLGFPEIRKIRAENLEDWVIDFKFVPEYKYGVFEIKGADERTSLADLTQCNKWVDDYIVENRGIAKGIFVPSQYRLGDITKNKEKREHFENNELKYAGSREICILPSHEILYAVVEKMKGKSQITRKFIEEKIAISKGICKLSEAQ